MGIDIAIALVVFIAFIKGYQEGLIMSLFTISAYIVGFFAALHCSFVIANYLQSSINIPQQWIPIVSFILLFLAVMVIVRLFGKILEKVFGKLLPTSLNKFAGGLFWALFGFILMALFIHLLDGAELFTQTIKASSATMPYIEKANVLVKSRIGEIFPFISNLYQEIDDYFETLANQIKE
jgi:membrane protein required for colicin V production